MNTSKSVPFVKYRVSLMVSNQDDKGTGIQWLYHLYSLKQQYSGVTHRLREKNPFGIKNSVPFHAYSP